MNIADIVRGMRDTLTAYGHYPDAWEAANEWLLRHDEKPLQCEFGWGGIGGGRYVVKAGDEYVGYFYPDGEYDIEDFLSRAGIALKD